MFGDQAVRLLREKWGGVIEPDANGNLVERGATRLAEELYAMFDDDIPLTQNAPLRLNKTNPNAPGLDIHNTVGGPSLTIDGGATSITGGDFSYANTGGDFTVNAGSVNFPGTIVTIGPSAADGKPGIGVLRNPTAFDPPPPEGRPFVLRLPPIDQIETEGGGNLGDDLLSANRGSSLGLVVSGTGKTYQVDLYEAGPDADATERVTAKVPQLATGETIPAGTWIAAVHRTVVSVSSAGVATYRFDFQPPVWL